MSDTARAFVYTVLAVLVTLGVVKLATYAADHPDFAKNVLIPILSLAGFIAIWGFFYTMIRAGKG